MPLFYYKATTLDGEIVDGILNAIDEKFVIESLKDSKLIPLKISYSQKKSNKISFLRRSTSSYVLLFTNELSALLGAGLALDRSLYILSEISQKNAMRDIIASILKSIREGKSFSDALSKHPKVFPTLYVNVVRAGEAGGVLEAVMGELTGFLESVKELKDSVYSAMIYPILLSVSGAVSVGVLLTYVIPKFSQIFDDLGQTIPLSTQILLSTSKFLSSYWWLVLGSLVIAVIGIKKFLATPKGQFFWDSLKLKLLKDVVLKLETSRFCRTLGTLLKSGVPLLTALKNVKDVVGNVIIRSSIDTVIKGAKEGKGITNPIISTGMFPPLAISMIKVGEETGQLDIMLLKVANTYEKSLRTAIKRLITILEPLMILIMGVVIGFIVMSMLLTIFSINDVPL
ncbi:type II secretory pathway, component PulF [Candidatus Magnetoovum chiemensis]|nr:type II secretory pathway, component PulF [Candidatus Magnetoovum chiemensis]